MTACISTVEQFLAHALAIEREAVARYTQFADQMLIHNNPEVAELFQRLAKLESAHHEKLNARARDRALAAIKPWEYAWIDPESPEAAPLDAVHYLMSPHHALHLALANEERARRFFQSVATAPTSSEEMRAMAHEFAADEAAHAASIEAMIERTPAPHAAAWDVDLDPPVVVD